MSRIRVGLIGVGGVGEVLLKAFLRSSQVEVVGIYDSHPDRLRTIAREYQVKGYEQDGDLISNPEVDLVYIGVPPKYHYPLVLACIRHQKHILCEKPLANSLLEAREMAEAAANSQQVHAINFPTIYRAACQEFARQIQSGFLGKLRKIELQAYFTEWPRAWQQNSWIHTREQGGFIKEVFPHYIQIIHMLFGSLNLEYSMVEYPENIELCETGVIAAGRLEDDTPVLLNASSQLGREEKISFTVIGSEGCLSLVNWKKLWISTKEGIQTQIELPANDHLQLLINEVIKAINQEPAQIVDFQEGLQIQQILDQF